MLNIDSSFRNIYPKNIVSSNNKTLPNNPFKLIKDNKILTINYPNHNLTKSDIIAIQNVEGINHTLIDSFYLVNNLKYLVIYYENNYIEITNNKLYFNISIIGEQTENNYISNIQFNNLIGIKQYYNYNNLSNNDIQIVNNFLLLNFGNINMINKCIFVELPSIFIDINNSFVKINQIFKISYLHIGGIKLGYFNSNYPINNYNYQSHYPIYNIIDNNTFQIELPFVSSSNINGGGNNIQIMKIINSMVGYPDANNYTIHLNKCFNNVINIELVSTEIPYVDLLIKKNINDKLYWKNIEDGDYVYNLIIDEGYYSSSELLNQILLKINNIPRLGHTDINPLYNIFDVIFESNLQKITFKPYTINKLPNSVYCHKEIINSIYYYVLTIKHENNIVEIGDIITINNCSSITIKNITDNKISYDSIDSSYINKEHKVYSVNLENQTYDIILGNINQINIISVNNESNGGNNLTIKSKTKVSFLFDRKDTFGDLLGFKNVGDKYSIIDYSSIITNQDSYIYSNNLDYIGNNYTYSNGFIDLVGKYNYMFMYLNDIENVHSNNLSSCFSKILLDGKPGDILFNTFIQNPSNCNFINYPISTLTDINIKFVYPDSNLVNFRNINHSFTLKITEEQTQNDDTYLNSQKISFIDEMKKLI